MKSGEIERLLASPPHRFRTIRCEVHVAIDFEVMAQALPDQARDAPGVRTPLDERHRLWLAPPDRYRHEELDAAGNVRSAHGLRGEESWQWPVEDGRVLVSSTRGSMIGLQANGSSDYVAADYEVSLHPILAELFSPPGFEEYRFQEEIDHAGRRAAFVVVPYGRTEWPDAEWPPATTYSLIVDVETGTLLRVSALWGEEEFSVREVTEVAFDEDLPGEIWDPPDVPHAAPFPWRGPRGGD